MITSGGRFESMSSALLFPTRWQELVLGGVSLYDYLNCIPLSGKGAGRHYSSWRPGCHVLYPLTPEVPANSPHASSSAVSKPSHLNLPDPISKFDRKDQCGGYL